ncbi:Aspartyl-tRNA(Asn) amidotransferase subunit A @ Glutamyl-tRNA(Gln) amidotransferase subunit A [plant metagenome]|uniref:Aspartyl-tRNA(Asn) amidotransferase subunit A @ Glutamyl-tRNA(Gln) amidotransferase subunit A n=2 Tax=root TaxID=1 RepID=A0A1C3K251_9BURK|nr:amidase [Orrella dioscoreae]SBT25582.1 Aspartyl-tRNA(Asn) amidotransferase subunit A @ Glutamyl-tRNA(Gln) amidotransferase subunit A [Orrella dioscoreae]SOE51024.1 Aspartyl-tRNA(Asn) amidotransferase subunit A @ Glutamyl-tRNA(Gln) amidotransferase subunit A [Orrella dioscoreae]
MITDLALAELADRLRRRELQAEEAVRAYLSRIDALDGWLHAYVAVYAEEALDAARAVDLQRAAGVDLGPLHGVPIALKDIIDIAGKPTSIGSPIHANTVAHRSADLVVRLRRAGAIILGKTHMVQFAMGAWGPNEHMGTPRNPWDDAVHRIPGGSSSGSAVAVAGRLAPVAIGTDTGGSVRVPASYCGITGLKPTVGRIDATGVVTLSQTLDSVGIFAHSAADTRIVFDALAPAALGEWAESIDAPRFSASGLTLGRLPDAYLENVQPEMLSAYADSLALFRELGARIVTVAPPVSLDAFKAVTGDIMMTEGVASFEREMTDLSLPVDGSVRPRLLAALDVPARRYLAALRDRDRLQAEMEARLRGIAGLLTPTTLTTALPLTEVDHGNAPVQYTRIGNLLQMCGVSLPNGRDAAGLPTGLQILCPGGDDRLALFLAELFQRHSDHHKGRADPRPR